MRKEPEEDMEAPQMPATDCLALPRLLSRWDFFVLLCFLVDSVSETLVGGLLNLYLSENFRASDSLAALVLGLASVSGALVMIALGHLIDKVPKRGPMGMVLVTKIGMAVAVLAMIVLDVATRGPGLRPIAFVGTVLLLLVAYIPLDTLGSLAFTLTIKRSSEGRDMRVRPALYNFQYAVFNLASALSNGLTSLVRGQTGRAQTPNANALLMGLGACTAGLTALFGGYLFRRLSADRRFHAVRQSMGDAYSDTPGSIRDWARGQWRQLNTRAMGIYLLMKLSLVGAAFAALATSAILPKYMIRRFEENALFALFQAINPAMMIVLAAALPFTPLNRVNTLVLLIAGTAVQALAPLWPWALPDAEWAVAVYMVQFTLGEALAMPRLSEFYMNLIPSGQEGFFTSVGQVPGIFLGLVLNALSALALDAYCGPGVGACRAARTHDLWLWVCLASVTTPIAIAVVRVIHERAQARNDTLATVVGGL